METHTDPAELPVLIVGAGPTGLVLACELARRGVPLRIVERDPAFRRESRGKGLRPGPLALLDELGAGAELRAVGFDDLPMRKYWRGDQVSETTVADMGKAARGLLIAQWSVEEALRRVLDEQHGIRVELGRELASFEEAADGASVIARFTDGGEIRASRLVGADGGRSTVRKRLPIAFEGVTTETEQMVVGDVEAPGLSRDAWHQFFDEQGGVLLCPMPGTEHTFQIQGMPELAADGSIVPPSLELFQRLFERYARRTDITLRNPTWLSVYRVNERLADRYRVGRVLLAGDAAHVHAIAGGLGMNTGIEDAHRLAEALAAARTAGEGPDADAELDAYAAERRDYAAWLLGATREALDRATEAIRTPGGGLEAAAVETPSP